MDYQSSPSYQGSLFRDFLLGAGCIGLAVLFYYLAFSAGRPEKGSNAPQAVKIEQPSEPAWDFKLYKDPSSSFILRYPDYLRIVSSSSEEVRLKSDEKGIELIASSWDGGMIPGLSFLYEDEIKERSKSWRIVYKSLSEKNLFYVISGKNDKGSIFYRRVVLKDGSFLSIETIYPESQKAAGEVLVNTFATFPEMNNIRLSGELIQNTSKFPVEFKLTVSQDGTVSGYYWYKKYKESNHINISWKVSNSQGLLILITEKGTEKWVFANNGSGPLSFYSVLRGSMYKYENNEARLAGNAPIKEYVFTLRQ